MSNPAAHQAHAAADVLVIGGGVIGLAIAWRAAQRGLAVIVADPSPGQGATYAAAGMLTPLGMKTMRVAGAQKRNVLSNDRETTATAAQAFASTRPTDS